jgi:hypothetical protein
MGAVESGSVERPVIGLSSPPELAIWTEQEPYRARNVRDSRKRADDALQGVAEC